LGLQAVGAFMRNEYSLDNLDFIVAVDDMRFRVLDRDELCRDAKKIYAAFLQESGPREVTYPAKFKAALAKQLNNPTRDMFGAIYDSVLATCRVDVFPRFLKSKLYEHIVTDLRARLKELASRRRQELESKAKASVSISPDAHIRFTRKQSAIRRPVRRMTLVHSFEEVLLDPEYLMGYVAFCTREHSEENILFWCAAHGYLRAAQEENITQDQLRSTAAHIHDLYLRPGAPWEILIDPFAKRYILAHLSAPDRYLFLPAQKQVMSLMQKDSGIRFLRSAEYAALVKKRKSETKGVYCEQCW